MQKALGWNGMEKLNIKQNSLGSLNEQTVLIKNVRSGVKD